MKVSKKDIFRPANAVSVAGLALSMWGARRINTYRGLLAFGVGRIFDLLDGPIARRTGSSDLGAAIDASADKIALGVGAYMLWKECPDSRSRIAAIAAHNVSSAGITLGGQAKNGNRRPSKAGKHSIFVESLSIIGMGLEQSAAKHEHKKLENIASFLSKLAIPVSVIGDIAVMQAAQETGIIPNIIELPHYFQSQIVENEQT